MSHNVKLSPHSGYLDLFVKGHGIEFKTIKQNLDLSEVSLSWSGIYNELDLSNDSVVLVCGAKNNGKSSLLRYIVNRALKTSLNVGSNSKKRKRLENGDSKLQCVYYMDCDPGQPELTTAGLISAHMIKNELVSPQYLNIWQHEEIVVSSVAGINMNIDPVVYINNCAFVYERLRMYRRSKEAPVGPIFINTMGWVKNVGLAMLTDLIKVTCPTHVVVLNAVQDPLRVLYAEIDTQSLRNTPFSFYPNEPSDASQEADTRMVQKSIKRHLRHSLHVHNLNFAFKDCQTTARLNRSSSQLAYMAIIRDSMYMPLLKTPAKRLSLNKVSVYCCASYPLKPRIVMELLPNAWVHLCRIEKEPCVSRSTSPNEVIMENDALDSSEKNQSIIGMNVSTCLETNIVLGCGLVIRVDAPAACVYIVTPLDEKTLNEQVDCLVKPLGIPFAPEANMNYQDSDVYDKILDIMDTNVT